MTNESLFVRSVFQKAAAAAAGWTASSVRRNVSKSKTNPKRSLSLSPPHLFTSHRIRVQKNGLALVNLRKHGRDHVL